MNKKGQMEAMGMFLSIFVVIVVGLALFTPTADHINTATGTVSGVNLTYTTPADGSTIDLTGQELLNTPIVTNATGGEVVTSTNYTIDEGISTTTGLKSVQYTSATNSAYSANSVNISYNYGADGYIDDSGARSVTTIILVLFALGIAVVTLSPTLRSNLLELVGR